ncbi:MAG: HPr(Ser) kinase/phosphatase [Eubacterium sp.]|nr:HPr(Ser) kinase/phosphatase [Eubacterium sp.]
MAAEYFVTLEKIIEFHKLEVVYLPKNAGEIKIKTSEINRPGIVLTGYTDYFDPLRIQILGWTELGFMLNMSDDERNKALGFWLGLKPAAAVITRGLEIPEYFIDACREYEVPLLKTDEDTSPFLAAMIENLNKELAPRITRHGVLVEVYGEGVLITGESGAGKSEAAIELIKRGHRLIADDAVEIRKISDNTLMGNSPSNIRHFVELRGIGIIDARRIFGMGAVKLSEKIDMVIQLEAWDSTKAYDRLGLDNEYANILGVRVPAMTVPITPGRNLAVIVETAAMNNRQKKMGYNAAKDLMISLGMEDINPEDREVDIWQN